MTYTLKLVRRNPKIDEYLFEYSDLFDLQETPHPIKLACLPY